ELKPELDRDFVSTKTVGQRRKRGGVGDSALSRQVERQVTASVYDANVVNGAVAPDIERENSGWCGADRWIDVAGAPSLCDFLAQQIDVVAEAIPKWRAASDADAARTGLADHGANERLASRAIKLIFAIDLLGTIFVDAGLLAGRRLGGIAALERDRIRLGFRSFDLLDFLRLRLGNFRLRVISHRVDGAAARWQGHLADHVDDHGRAAAGIAITPIFAARAKKRKNYRASEHSDVQSDRTEQRPAERLRLFEDVDVRH